MPSVLHLILLVLALVLFLVAAAQPAHPLWNRFVALGLAALALNWITW